MRLFLLPISTRRTLIYAQRSLVPSTGKPAVFDRLSQKAAQTWADWEKKEKGWQKQLTEYGNRALQKIPFEEWALKNVALSRSPRDGLGEIDKVEVVFPKHVITPGEVLSRVHTLGTERTSFHKSRMIYAIIGMPITIPCMLVPVIPNIPFFYLVYRAFSHWHALSGSKHLQFLFHKNLLMPVDSPIANEVYAQASVPKASAGKAGPGSKEGSELMLLTVSSARRLGTNLAIPELVVELERAVLQVSTSLENARREKARDSAAANEKVESIEPGKKD